MLIEFRVSNYRSIGEEQVISLVPELSQKEHEGNIYTRGKHTALNSLALYGGNSAGKSNILKALELLDKLLYLSAHSNSTTKLPYDPFLLKEDYHKKPTSLEIVFVVEETRYRYGLEFNQKKILAEWLHRKKIGREVELFIREEDIIEVSSGFAGSSKVIDTAIEATRSNALFLSFCDMLNVTEAKKIFKWFNQFIFVDSLHLEKEEFQTIHLWENSSFREKVKNYLSLLNLGFRDVFVQMEEFDPKKLPDDLDEGTRDMITQELSGRTGFSVNTTHKMYNKSGESKDDFIAWSMEERESEGTKKAFYLSGPILHTLLNGGLLVIDEIEAKTHPIITINIVKLFLSKETNPLNAQIIFATHDTNLLSYTKLRRDQINFVEKNKWEATQVWALSDFKYKESQQKERPDVDKEKRYLEGRYEAIPVLGSFVKQIDHWHGKKG